MTAGPALPGFPAIIAMRAAAAYRQTSQGDV